MFLSPDPPPYDPLEWVDKPFPERARMVCEAWAMQGYGSPVAVYLVYVVKVLLYVLGWASFCSLSPELGPLGEIATWAFRPLAFQKAIVWSLLFEVVGLGCGSGPLTGRYMPPMGGMLYFLRPGTTKLPVFEGAPVVGRNRRGILDVSLYAALLGACLVFLVSPAREPLLAIAVLLPVLGILDKTLFLCARGEHYWTTVLVMVLAEDWIPGAKGVHASLWFWAGVSKLNHHFPAVVGVMTSNSPMVRFRFVKKLMYRDFPRDLNPSRFAAVAAHAGLLLELGVPLVLATSHGGVQTTVGLVLMVMLHGFITSNVPMGVPIEWNFMMVYGGFFLFGTNAAVSIASVTLPVAVVLGVVCVAIPLVGNLFPERVPFLLAMRYYAGNWAYSVWFFKKGAEQKLEQLVKSSRWVYDQLGTLYDRRTSVGLVGRVMAFRLMHLHGRLLPALLGRAVPDLRDYEWLDGEIVAGMVLGWNFGDGHLHGEQLLRAMQEQCGFEEGEVR
ncbi:MAG TPA: DUF3556 domain-containing protein, partial [Polyangiaceae bacterium]|nr:DUF3556 domain-containing protein [Polyangiaceae bacterium]